MKALKLAMINTLKKISRTLASMYNMAALVSNVSLPYNTQRAHRTEETTSLYEHLGTRTRGNVV